MGLVVGFGEGFGVDGRGPSCMLQLKELQRQTYTWMKNIITIVTQYTPCSNLSDSFADAVLPADFAVPLRFWLSVGMLDLAVVEATSCEAGLRFGPVHCGSYWWHNKSIGNQK